MCLFLDYNVENYDLKAPTGILLGATDQEFASSSLRLTCTCSCMIRVRKLEEDFEEIVLRKMRLTSSKNWPWLASTSRPASLSCTWS